MNMLILTFHCISKLKSYIYFRLPLLFTTDASPSILLTAVTLITPKLSGIGKVRGLNNSCNRVFAHVVQFLSSHVPAVLYTCVYVTYQAVVSEAQCR